MAASRSTSKRTVRGAETAEDESTEDEAQETKDTPTRVAVDEDAAENQVTEESGNSRNLYEERQGPQIHIDDTVLPYLPEGSARIGHFAVVTEGDDENKNKYGVVENVLTFDSKGWPKTVAFRTRDAVTELLEIDYENLKAVDAGRR